MTLVYMPCGSPWCAAFPVCRTTPTRHCLRATIRCSGSAHCGLEGAGVCQWRRADALQWRDLCLQTHFAASAAGHFALPFGPFHAVIRFVQLPCTARFAGWNGKCSQLALNQWIAPVRHSVCNLVMNLDKTVSEMKCVNKNAMGNAANEHPRMHSPSIPLLPCVAPC